MPDQPNDDRDQELERDVRDAMEGMASEAAPPPSPPPEVLRTAKRRLVRNSTALVVALVLIAGGVAAGLQFTNRDSDSIGPQPSPTTQVPSPTESPEPSPDETGEAPTPSSTEPEPSPTVAEPSPTETLPSGGGGTGTGPLPVMLFLDGRVWRYVNGTKGLAGIPIGSIPEQTAAQPPVATPYGIVVLGGTPGRAGNLWLMQSNGDRQLLHSGVNGFGVSGDGSLVAYSVGGRRILIEHSLVTGVDTASCTGCTTFPRVVGYAGSHVILETGDGAGAMAATWEPHLDIPANVFSIDGFGSALGTDPTSNMAVLNQGDGLCWWTVRIGPDGSSDPVQQGDQCGSFFGISFESGGATLAGVEADFPGSVRHFLVIAGTDSALGGKTQFNGAFQTWWAESTRSGPGSILVLSGRTAGSLAVTQCRVSENLCSNQPVWTGFARELGGGSAWIVEERPA